MAKTYSCVLVGVEARLIEIETVLGSGFSGLNILGLPTDTTRDMRERVRSALESVGIPIPARRVVVNIGPGDAIKLSRTPLSQLDFAVAASIIHALFQEQDNKKSLATYEHEVLAGELSLEGKLRPLVHDLIFNHMDRHAFSDQTICLPSPASSDATSFAETEGGALSYERVGWEYFSSLQQWIQKRRAFHKTLPSGARVLPSPRDAQENPVVSLDTSAKETMKRLIRLLMHNASACVGLLVACAGKHNVLLAGEPGIGKSFTLKQTPAFLLPPSVGEQTALKLINPAFVEGQRPFRAPHHSSTSASLVGGASLKPAEVTLAHGGVLFLDELAEFNRNSLESLREPLDNGHVTVSRAGGCVTYPAHFQLYATANPCACGYLLSRKKPCRCNPKEARKYLQKISGPLLDRFCLQIWMREYEAEEWDIFAREMLNIVGDERTFDEFIERFVALQSASRHTKMPTFRAHEPHLSFALSLRGQEKIQQVSHTFQKLFPQLATHPSFLEEVLKYRDLGRLFSSIYF